MSWLGSRISLYRCLNPPERRTNKWPVKRHISESCRTCAEIPFQSGGLESLSTRLITNRCSCYVSWTYTGKHLPLRIELNSTLHLEELFNDYWRILFGNDTTSNFALPFFHLKQDGFWSLIGTGNNSVSDPTIARAGAALRKAVGLRHARFRVSCVVAAACDLPRILRICCTARRRGIILMLW
jgi:hypothetical protein